MLRARFLLTTRDMLPEVSLRGGEARTRPLMMELANQLVQPVYRAIYSPTDATIHTGLHLAR